MTLCTSNRLLQVAECLLCIKHLVGDICPRSCCFFFLPSLSSVGWHFHLSNREEPSTEQADLGHMQRCDIRLTAQGIGSEKQTAHSPCDLTQAHLLNVHTLIQTHAHTYTHSHVHVPSNLPWLPKQLRKSLKQKITK